jgi:hypothetical protein
MACCCWWLSWNLLQRLKKIKDFHVDAYNLPQETLIYLYEYQTLESGVIVLRVTVWKNYLLQLKICHNFGKNLLLNLTSKLMRFDFVLTSSVHAFL